MFGGRRSKRNDERTAFKADRARGDSTLVRLLSNEGVDSTLVRLQREIQQDDTNPGLTVERVATLTLMPQDSIRFLSCLADTFDIGEEIGWGEFSSIRSATHCEKMDSPVALKISDADALSSSVDVMRSTRAEVSALRAIPSHPNIVELHAVVCTRMELALEFELLREGSAIYIAVCDLSMVSLHPTWYLSSAL